MNEMRSLAVPPAPIKLRVEDYLLLDDAGAYDAVGPTELIEGEVFAMNAEHRPHARIKARLLVALTLALRDLDIGLEAAEVSVAMPPDNAPLPDIVVTDDMEGEGLAPVASVRLIVEVSASTLARDLKDKVAIYARQGVPEYWVVEVEKRVVHQMHAPDDDGYAKRRTVPLGQPLAAATIAGLTIDTATL